MRFGETTRRWIFVICSHGRAQGPRHCTFTNASKMQPIWGLLHFHSPSVLSTSITLFPHTGLPNPDLRLRTANSHSPVGGSPAVKDLCCPHGEQCIPPFSNVSFRFSDACTNLNLTVYGENPQPGTLVGSGLSSSDTLSSRVRSRCPQNVVQRNDQAVVPEQSRASVSPFRQSPQAGQTSLPPLRPLRHSLSPFRRALETPDPG